MAKGQIKAQGKVRSLLNIMTLLGVLLVIINLMIYGLGDPYAGLLVSGFAVFYFILYIMCRLYLGPKLTHEMVSFATEYGQVQKTLLYDMDLPYAVADGEGNIIWTNQAFEKIAHSGKEKHLKLKTLFPAITPDTMPDEEDKDVSVEVELGDSIFSVLLHRISLKHMVSHSELLDLADDNSALFAVYLYDVTALKLALAEVDDQSLVSVLIYLDNYDEAMESVEEVRRSLLTALIDRKVNRYIASANGISKKFEKDKYFVVMTKKAAMQLMENRFEILEDVKTVNIGNEMAVTISVGVGIGGFNYTQNYEYARNAIDLALGRGGDQAVVKTSEKITYYGGKSQKVEKNTRVKARVKAHALEEIITSNDKVIVMGHRLGDVDSFGACVGIYRIAKALSRKCHIVLNDVTTSTSPLVDLFRGNPDYESDMIVSSDEAIDLAGNSTAVVVVDVNKPSITDCPELLRQCKTIVVFDHHRAGTETIENATLSYVEPYASSTCEMVSEILQYTGDNIKVPAAEANCLYSGIMIDTNNFTQRAGVRTFEAAAFLRRMGADVTVVRKLFRENVTEYKAKADAVSQAEIYKASYAISTCQGEGMLSPTIIGAQAANELLNIKGVKASFICTEYQNLIYVSARSIDEVNVQIIMERLGGGGHLNIAGCQMENITVTEAVAVIKQTLDAMMEEGAI